MREQNKRGKAYFLCFLCSDVCFLWICRQFDVCALLYTEREVCLHKARKTRKSFHYRSLYTIFAAVTALVAKLVDAPDLGSGGFGRVGSSPIRRTKKRKTNTLKFILYVVFLFYFSQPTVNRNFGLLQFYANPAESALVQYSKLPKVSQQIYVFGLIEWRVWGSFWLSNSYIGFEVQPKYKPLYL